MIASVIISVLSVSSALLLAIALRWPAIEQARDEVERAARHVAPVAAGATDDEHARAEELQSFTKGKGIFRIAATGTWTSG